MAARLGGFDKTGMTEEGVLGLGDRIRGCTAFGSDKTGMTDEGVSGSGDRNKVGPPWREGDVAGLGGTVKTSMTEESVSGPGDRIRGKTCGLQTLSWMWYFLAMRGTPCQVVI